MMLASSKHAWSVWGEVLGGIFIEGYDRRESFLSQQFKLFLGSRFPPPSSLKP